MAWVISEVPRAQTVLRLPASSITGPVVLEISFILFFGDRDDKGQGKFSLQALGLLNRFKGKVTSPAHCEAGLQLRWLWVNEHAKAALGLEKARGA